MGTRPGTDDALWSRVKLVLFEVSFADRVDLKLPEKLRAELSGILNWAIQGCLDWQRAGLRPPEKVKAATQKYRIEQDVVAQFLQDCCVIVPAARIKAKRLYEAYTTWCGENEHEALNQRRFGAYLTEHGFPSDDNATGRGAIRTGINLQDPSDEKKSATHSRGGSQKDSTAKSQQRRAENDMSNTFAPHATSESEKSPTAVFPKGLSRIWGSMGSNSKEDGVDTHDAGATLPTAKGSTASPNDGVFDEGVI